MADISTLRADVAKVQFQRQFEIVFGVNPGINGAINGYQGRVTTLRQVNEAGLTDLVETTRIIIPTVANGRPVYFDDKIKDVADNKEWTITQLELGEMRASYIITCQRVLVAGTAGGGGGTVTPITISILSLAPVVDALGSVIRRLRVTSTVQGTIVRGDSNTVYGAVDERETSPKFTITFNTTPTWNNAGGEEEYWVAGPNGIQYLIDSFSVTAGITSAIATRQDTVQVVP